MTTTHDTLLDLSRLRRACRRHGIGLRIRKGKARFTIAGYPADRGTVIPWKQWSRHRRTYDRLVELRDRYSHLPQLQNHEKE